VVPVKAKKRCQIIPIAERVEAQDNGLGHTDWKGRKAPNHVLAFGRLLNLLRIVEKVRRIYVLRRRLFEDRPHL
jgi:hypothetical protein